MTKKNNEEADGMALGCFYDDAQVERIKPGREYRTIDSRSLSNSFYRGEGNATFVVALPNERKVLRLEKFDQKNGDAPSEDDGEARVRLALNFHTNVICSLMGSYAKEPEIVRCNRDDLKTHLMLFEPHRPANRRHKTVTENFATVLPDYTLLPDHILHKIPPTSKTSTFSIEIKPKEEEMEISSLSKCRNFHKLCTENLHNDNEQPSYCSRCLFSGESGRMDRAIRGLVINPRNRFKIFQNGHYVWGGNSTTSDLHKIIDDWLFTEKSNDEKLTAVIELMREALLRPFSQSDFTFNYPISSNSAFSTNLPEDCVLERIQRVQRNYRLDIDSIYPIYARYSTILNEEMVYDQIETREHEEKSVTPSFEELQDLRNYLVYRIARDCSILMAFREIDRNTINDVPAENVIRISNDRYFLFNNAITDLDPKSVHCIEKHYQRSHRIPKGMNSRSLEGRNPERTDSIDTLDKFVNSITKFGVILTLGVIAMATVSLRDKHIEFCLSLNNPDRILLHLVK